jgi:hypothetical protein
VSLWLNNLAMVSRPFQQSLLIWFLFSLIFISLRSQQYMAVDGAIGCFQVYRLQQIYFHGNNHLLYPSNVHLWHQFLSLFGLKAGGPLEYISLTQIMNCLAAAGCIAAIYRLSHAATASWVISFGVATGYAFSRAFLLHATNAAEPVLGLFWSLLAIEVTVIALQRGWSWLISISGLLLSLAMANYQSMILIGPVAAFLCFKWPAKRGKNFFSGETPALRLAYLTGGGIVGVALIYGFAYSYSGTQGIAAMIERFLFLKGNSIYGSLELKKIATIPFALIGNIFYFSLFPIIAVLFFGIIPFFAYGIKELKSKYENININYRLSINSAAIGFGLTIIAPAYWMVGYDKLWLQPILCLFFLSALLLKITPRGFLRQAAVLLLAIEIISNLAWALPSHFKETRYLKEARQVEQIVRPEDLIINDWDGVSVLYGTIWGKGYIYNIPTSAEENVNMVLNRLEQEIERARERGGQVYFLGVLDHTEEQWENHLGRRGLAYNSFDKYRKSAVAVLSFKIDREEISLRRLE